MYVYTYPYNINILIYLYIYIHYIYIHTYNIDLSPPALPLNLTLLDLEIFRFDRINILDWIEIKIDFFSLAILEKLQCLPSIQVHTALVI
jgi:hypothetical protein